MDMQSAMISASTRAHPASTIAFFRALRAENPRRPAFTAYETAYRNNAPTDLAQSNMRACMDRIKELLNTRYSQGVLRAGR